MTSTRARGRRLGPPPIHRSTTAVLATTRDQGTRGGRRLQGLAVRVNAWRNEEQGMSRRAKGRQLQGSQADAEYPLAGAGGRAGLPEASDRSSRRSHRADYRDRNAAKGSVAGFVFRAIAVSVNHDRLPVMHQPVDHGGCQGVVHIEDRAPIPEGAIRGDDDRAAFVPGGE